MGRASKTLDQMRTNPQGWRIEDISTACNQLRELGVELRPPTRGSHYKVVHPNVPEILTIPAKRPLKAIYVKRFISMIDSIVEISGDNDRP